MMSYTHVALGEEIRALAGFYVIEAEHRVPFVGRQVLVATGHLMIDNAGCGIGGCSFALVPGYVAPSKVTRTARGEPVSQVEPIREEHEKEALRRLIVASESVQQVNFW